MKNHFIFIIRLSWVVGIIYGLAIPSGLLAQDTIPAQAVQPIKLNFNSFVKLAEENSNYRFFFTAKDLNDLVVDYDSSKSIKENVIEAISKSQFYYYFDNSGNIIIYSGKPIIKELPDFSEAGKGQNEIKSPTKTITESEKKYVEARNQITELELITIGNKQNAATGKPNIVRGRIVDNESGEPLIGATFYVNELEIGAATDLDGYFNIAIVSGKYLVNADCMAMESKKFYLEVYDNGELTIPLNRELVSINEVTVTADRHDNVRGIQMGFERISTKTIKEIPTVMGEKDLLKVAQLLPGVQTAGEGTSGLLIRGGTADQNQFIINKMPVYNTSHMFGFFSSFSSEIVSDFSMYKSNIPAKYGGRVASVFDISTKHGNKKNFFAKGGISPVTAHLVAEGPIVKDKTSYVVSFRGTYSDWILSQLDDINLQQSSASFYDLSFGVNSEINKKNIVKAFGYASDDKFSLSTTDDYNYYNRGGSLNLTHFFSPSLKGDFALVHSTYGFGHNDKNNESVANRQEYELQHSGLKGDFVLQTNKNHRVLFGGDLILYNLNRGTVNPYNDSSNWRPINMGKEKAIESALYISDEFSLFPRLTLLVGLRYSMYTMLGPKTVNEYASGESINEDNITEVKEFVNNQIVQYYSGLEPRLAFNYSLGYNKSIKASYNRLNQYIFILSNTLAISPTDQWKLADYHLKPQTFDQVSVGYYHDIPMIGLNTSVEAYRKWGSNIVEYRDGADFISEDPIEMQVLQGKQDAYGIELMIKKNTGNLTGWLAYSYSRSEIVVANSILSERINFGNPYPSNFDKPHSINFVTNLRSNKRFSVSANAVYSTGRPISYPVATYLADGVEVLHYSERNKYRIPDYFRVDLSFNLEGNLQRKKWIHSYWMLNIYNVTGRKNAYSVYFEAEDGRIQGYKLSVFGQPIITLSWNFKLGNYTNE
jgi:hypothetical protein